MDPHRSPKSPTPPCGSSPPPLWFCCLLCSAYRSASERLLMLAVALLCVSSSSYARTQFSTGLAQPTQGHRSSLANSWVPRSEAQPCKGLRRWRGSEREARGTATNLQGGSGLPVLLAARGGADSANDQVLCKDEFKLVDEKYLYRGNWRSLLSRTIRYPDGKVIPFDVVHQPGESVIVFAWNSTSNTTTLVQEFAPGPLDVIEGIVAGGVESKHLDDVEAAAHELEEEARLVGGTWHRLMDGPHAAAPADKYQTSAFHFFLCVDPDLAHNSLRELDHEELLAVRRGVTVPQMLALIRAGRMTVPAACGALLALEKLRELGLL